MSKPHPFHPEDSIFVSANAGAGKTRLLTDRVLALLLNGVIPSKIICLTYTKAAAAEMKSRVNQELGNWVMAQPQTLNAKLEELLNRPPATHETTRARSLFAQVLESAEGVRMLTIHSLCQSLLRRFPLEANVSPHFNIMDNRSEQNLQYEARMKLLSYAQKSAASIQDAIAFIATEQAESRIDEFLKEIFSAKSDFKILFSGKDGVLRAQERIFEALNVDPASTPETLFQEHFNYTPYQLQDLREVCAQLAVKTALGKADEQLLKSLQQWLEANGANADLIPEYKEAFINKEGRAKKFATKKGITDEALLEALFDEQQRLVAYEEEISRWHLARSTNYILLIASAVLTVYEKVKLQHAQLDYDDQIQLAYQLLTRPEIMPWVLFKLDGGIDHMLIDEAQDTSPTQWGIIDALTSEFFSGQGRSDAARSIFIVGDEKQSIYSFQGAQPKELGSWQKVFSQRCDEAGKTAHMISRTTSYRSCEQVLKAVDAIFASDTAKAGVTFDGSAIGHDVFEKKASEQGLVEFWPIIKPEEEDPDADEDHDAAAISTNVQLAQHIADNIKEWIDSSTLIGTANPRPVEAGDIMILVQKRGKLVAPLVRALKKRNIPLAGQDRMNLNDNLAVQDLIALGQVMLLPDDDLSAATVLKSPIGNLSEDTLFELCHSRGPKSVWKRLKEAAKNDNKLADVFHLLENIRAKSDTMPPYELYMYVLEQCGVRARITGRMGHEYAEALDEFLGQALLYEQSHTPSLQGFIQWLISSDSQIKRDMEESKGTVRILTVHASKGLQAPIVILADTVLSSSVTGRNMIKWYDKGGIKLPFWNTPQGKNNNFYAALTETQKQHAMQEYRRLLYVALTRAETRLYICGAQGSKKPFSGSWCELVEQGLKDIAQKYEHPLGDGALRLGDIPPKGIKKSAINTQNTLIAEDFSELCRLPPQEPSPPQPLVPSRTTSDQQGPSASPLDTPKLYQRGKLIHQLLQFLPQAKPSEREKLAQRIAAPYMRTMDEALCVQAIAESVGIIENTKFAHIFVKDALAEVPINGLVQIRGTPIAVSGQIDRLVISEDTVWIIDYKSNYAPPSEDEAIPEAYVRQMRLYQSVVQKIYPEKTINCALLWTAIPSLSQIEQSQLDEVAISTYI